MGYILPISVLKIADTDIQAVFLKTVFQTQRFIG
jgi:hypothetical protein